VNFHSAYDQGFARVAACTTQVHLADPASNVAGIIETVRELNDRGVAIAVFPELCLTGYNIDDLLLQDVVLDAALSAIETLRAASVDMLPVIVVGAPLRQGNRLYNCAVVVHRGRILGVVPKSYLPNYREFYEKRHFAAAADRTTTGVPSRLWRTGRIRRIPPRSRSVQTCCSAPSTSPGWCFTWNFARTCGCPCRPAQRPPWPEPPSS
jgi:NAD+ synthase (glutamine-hydrolysing)